MITSKRVILSEAHNVLYRTGNMTDSVDRRISRALRVMRSDGIRAVRRTRIGALPRK